VETKNSVPMKVPVELLRDTANDLRRKYRNNMWAIALAIKIEDILRRWNRIDPGSNYIDYEWFYSIIFALNFTQIDIAYISMIIN